MSSAVQGVTIQRSKRGLEARRLWRSACLVGSRARDARQLGSLSRPRAIAFLTSTRDRRTDNDESPRASHKERLAVCHFIWLRGRWRRTAIGAVAGRRRRNTPIWNANPTDSTDDPNAALDARSAAGAAAARGTVVGYHHYAGAHLFAVRRNDRRRRHGYLASGRRRSRGDIRRHSAPGRQSWRNRRRNFGDSHISRDRHL